MLELDLKTFDENRAVALKTWAPDMSNVIIEHDFEPPEIMATVRVTGSHAY